MGLVKIFFNASLKGKRSHGFAQKDENKNTSMIVFSPSGWVQNKDVEVEAGSHFCGKRKHFEERSWKQTRMHLTF